MERGLQIWRYIFDNLTNDEPKDTRNMVNHTYLVETLDYYKIIIDAPYATNPKVKNPPVGRQSYAREVNFSATIRDWHGRMHPNPNFGWVEKSIARSVEVLGGKVNYEIQ